MANGGLLLSAVPGYIGTRIGIHDVHRDLELRIRGHLYEIAAVNDEVLGSRQGFPASETGYRKTLQSVTDVAGPDLMDEVAASIKEHIRTHEERPANQAVRKDARKLVSKAGYPPDDYLNAA
jgi:hypothetical protein